MEIVLGLQEKDCLLTETDQITVQIVAVEEMERENRRVELESQNFYPNATRITKVVLFVVVKDIRKNVLKKCLDKRFNIVNQNNL